MPYVEYASEGRVLFRTESSDGAQTVPRIHEIVVVDDRPYQVVDVEYWARRLGSKDRRSVWPTVYLIPVSDEDWKRRLERRVVREKPDGPPVRY
ncbi:hypothetical protein PPSIR1_33404 [Plesiocystis pacifica SIR-1]|uniref:Uncharacterized protein n=1 Tax=Plesiocystis pacifica SIR-1 TaxID=391625 RepID=A6G6N7_9BACT|nr:hypothetical protein [Plesiocystis pacifica]EDM78514.1 hypothetical protein PPSIR1_33404 [Plesiocystis pacifica SIR-1]